MATGENEEGVIEPTLLPTGSLVAGKYRIVLVLGMGGNGAVYEGEHTDVGHRVAIKVVHTKLAEREDVIARFRREARIGGTLRHPHIGQVYDIGTLDDGAPYMVMELQEGRSLANVIDETKLPLPAVIDIVLQLLDALGAAHGLRTIHRDVKPDNVMIVRDHNGAIAAKLVDFGISKKLSAPPSDAGETAEEGIIGSPDYMSPEQLRGEALDERTDIYSTGVLLYEAITGRLPFRHKRLTDLYDAILRDPVEPPTSLRGDCSPELAQVVARAMAREKSARFASASEMSRALNEVRAKLRTRPVQTGPWSDTPPRSSATSEKERRRTIDTRTLEAIRVQTEARHPPATAMRNQRARLTPWFVAALLMLGAGTALAWLAFSPNDVRVTDLAATSAATPVPAATPSVQNAAPKAPQILIEQAQIGEQAPGSAAEPRTVNDQTAKPAERTAAQLLSKRRPSADAVPLAPQRSPDELRELLKQASSAYVLGQTVEAHALYREIVQASPSQADAWRGLGMAANRLGDSRQAARALRRYLALRPEAADAQRIREQLTKIEASQ